MMIELIPMQPLTLLTRQCERMSQRNGQGGIRVIVFRVDVNEQVATGHLMRCLTIATECRNRGETCLFVLADDKETKRITDRGFSYCVLHSRWDRMEEEVVSLRSLLEQYDCDWLVVDSYQATPLYLQTLNQYFRVLYLDDFGTEGYGVTAVLHYGLIEQPEKYIRHYRRKGITVLAGTEYIPLREEFQPFHLKELWQEQAKRQSVSAQPAILITTGGTDPYRVAAGVLKQCLEQDLLGRCRYHVIVGSMNDHVQELQQLVKQSVRDGSPCIELHYAVNQMADLMCQCDYAVSAGGTTLYELCACGVPTVCFSFADNQIPAVTRLDQHGIMRYAGDARDGEIPTEICHVLTEYIRHPEETSQYQTRMRELVDGRGVCRIADLLCQ